MREIKVGQIYKHFKGKEYKVLNIAYESEQDSLKVVVYEALYGDHKIWVRPYDMFNSLVDRQKYPNIKQKYRYEEI